MLWWGRSEQEIRTGGDAGARERQRRLDTGKKGGVTLCAGRGTAGPGSLGMGTAGRAKTGSCRDGGAEGRRLKPGGLP